MRYQPNRANKEYSVFCEDEGDHEDREYYSFKRTTDDLTHKFVMSCDPCRSDGRECVVVVIYGPHFRLACCSLYDTRWSPLPLQCDLCYDIIFYKGLLHGIIQKGTRFQVLAFENITGIDGYPKIALIAEIQIDNPIVDPRYSQVTMLEYLVESSDGNYLMIVERVIGILIENEDIGAPETFKFNVYKVDSKNRTCVELKSIGDDILIVGLNTSMSISSHNYIGYKRNHIYFTDSEIHIGCSSRTLKHNEIGVFSLEDGTFQPSSGPKFLWPLPIWSA